MNSDSFKNMCLGLGAFAVPIVIAMLGYIINTSLQEKEMEGRFVEMAVGILQNSESENSPALRDWSVKVIDRYSGVRLNDEASDELIEKGLPSFNHGGVSVRSRQYWSQLREEDRDMLWGDDHSWECFITGEKASCFPWRESCISEEEKEVSRGNIIDRPCGQILNSSDGW